VLCGQALIITGEEEEGMRVLRLGCDRGERNAMEELAMRLRKKGESHGHAHTHTRTHAMCSTLVDERR
jgi:hypothetical protein